MLNVSARFEDCYLQIAEFVKDLVLHPDKGNLNRRASDPGYLDDDLTHKHECEKCEASGTLRGKQNLTIDAIVKKELGKKCR